MTIGQDPFCNMASLKHSRSKGLTPSRGTRSSLHTKHKMWKSEVFSCVFFWQNLTVLTAISGLFFSKFPVVVSSKKKLSKKSRIITNNINNLCSDCLPLFGLPSWQQQTSRLERSLFSSSDDQIFVPQCLSNLFVFHLDGQSWRSGSVSTIFSTVLVAFVQMFVGYPRCSNQANLRNFTLKLWPKAHLSWDTFELSKALLLLIGKVQLDEDTLVFFEDLGSVKKFEETDLELRIVEVYLHCTFDLWKKKLEAS